MKIGIVSCYKHTNYGSMLQSYATQKAVEELGYDSVTMSYLKPINYMTQSRIRYYFHKITNKDIVKGKIRLLLSRQIEKNYPEVVEGRKNRDRYFEEFYKNRFNLSPMNDSRIQIVNFAESCDAMIVGSDQLWNPINVEHDFYTLTFVPDRIKKISYATSIGTSHIPQYQVETYKKFLNRVDYISVREKSGKEIIDNLGIEKKVEVVLDPTLLFDKKQWMCIQDERPVIEGKYILCYFLGVNAKHREFANDLKKYTGYKIIALQHLDEFVKNDLHFGDIHAYNVGPSEFINLIRNAEFVCTDSFHGSCFSIINHKRFFTLNRYSEANTQSTNTRIDSLFSITGLENRRVDLSYDKKDLKRMADATIDYASVDEKLGKERMKSLNFLKNALKGQ